MSNVDIHLWFSQIDQIDIHPCTTNDDGEVWSARRIVLTKADGSKFEFAVHSGKSYIPVLVAEDSYD